MVDIIFISTQKMQENGPEINKSVLTIFDLSLTPK